MGNRFGDGTKTAGVQAPSLERVRSWLCSPEGLETRDPDRCSSDGADPQRRSIRTGQPCVRAGIRSPRKHPSVAGARTGTRIRRKSHRASTANDGDRRLCRSAHSFQRGRAYIGPSMRMGAVSSPSRAAHPKETPASPRDPARALVRGDESSPSLSLQTEPARKEICWQPLEPGVGPAPFTETSRLSISSGAPWFPKSEHEKPVGPRPARREP